MNTYGGSLIVIINTYPNSSVLPIFSLFLLLDNTPFLLLDGTEFLLV